MHSGAFVSIYHRDSKLINILLDKNYGAKISDFGMLRPNPVGNTHVTTRVASTPGYLDPEYF